LSQTSPGHAGIDGVLPIAAGPAALYRGIFARRVLRGRPVGLCRERDGPGISGQRGFGLDPLKFREDLAPVHAGHAEIENDQRDVFRFPPEDLD
jgi:hypothetical protein